MQQHEDATQGNLLEFQYNNHMCTHTPEEHAYSIVYYYLTAASITSASTKFALNEVRNIVVAGRSFPQAATSTLTATIPADVKAVALVVTAMNGPATGYKALVRVYPGPASAVHTSGMCFCLLTSCQKYEHLFTLT